jgi:hypothetical protein
MPLQPYIRNLPDRLENTDYMWVLCAYAPCESHHDDSEKFYTELTTLMHYLNNTYAKDPVIIGGDMNAHVGPKRAEDPNGVGPHGRLPPEDRNTNGEHLVQFCKKFDLDLLNTHFPHKQSQLITWITSSDPKITELPLINNGGMDLYRLFPRT